jgi:hypothetical protein
MVTKTEQLLKTLKQKSPPQTPVGTELYLPNHSGDHSKGKVERTPTADIDIVNKAYCAGGRAIVFTIDGGGSAITTGIKGDLQIPFACTINSATLLADQSGSIVIDVWKDTYANYPPTDSDSITASAPPTISSATKSTDSTLTGWTTSITLGDTLRFNVDSITTITRAVLVLGVTRT